MYRNRIKLWSREIVLATLLTLAAAAFVGSAWLNETDLFKKANARLASGDGKGPPLKP